MIRVYSLILNKLQSFETMKWSDILGNKSHMIAVEKICRKAQARLKEIGQEDVDELVSLRFGSKGRLWGIRDNEYLKILWWDPNHEICTSQKKHT